MPITRTNFDLGEQEIPLDAFKEIKERHELEPIPQGVSMIRGYNSDYGKHVLIVRVGDKKLYIKIPLNGEDIFVEYADFGFRRGQYKKVKLPKPTLVYRICKLVHAKWILFWKKMYYKVAFGD
jgi:hypothetical protein